MIDEVFRYEDLSWNSCLLSERGAILDYVVVVGGVSLLLQRWVYFVADPDLNDEMFSFCFGNAISISFDESKTHILITYLPSIQNKVERGAPLCECYQSNETFSLSIIR